MFSGFIFIVNFKVMFETWCKKDDPNICFPRFTSGNSKICGIKIKNKMYNTVRGAYVDGL